MRRERSCPLALITRTVSFTVTFPSGQVEEFRADGTLATRLTPGGDLHHFAVDGRLQGIDFADGSALAATWAQDGSHTETTTSASSAFVKEAYYRADGTQRQAHYADGSNDYYDAAGVLLEPHPQPNGDVWYVDTQGRTERVDHADGSYELSSFAVDGSYVAHGFDAQGVEVRQVAHDPAGLVLWTREAAADNGFTVTYASGLVDHFRSDMTLATRTLVNGDTESYDLTGTRLTQVETHRGRSRRLHLVGGCQPHGEPARLRGRAVPPALVQPHRHPALHAGRTDRGRLAHHSA